MKQFFSPMDFKSCNALLIKMLTFALRKDFTPKLGLLELAIQNVFLSNNNLDSNELTHLYKFLIKATKRGHAIDPDFKIFCANNILDLAREYLKYDNYECVIFIKMIETLDMPPDKEFWLFAAKTYRTFGCNEDALEAYKEVLRLS